MLNINTTLELLKFARQYNNKQLAKNLKISESTLYRIYNGKITKKNYRKIYNRYYYESRKNNLYQVFFGLENEDKEAEQQNISFPARRFDDTVKDLGKDINSLITMYGKKWKYIGAKKLVFK